MSFLRPFVAWRLLVLKGDGHMVPVTIEFAHGAIIRAWPRIQRWMEPERDRLLTLTGPKSAAASWSRDERRKSRIVHQGRRLRNVLALRSHPDFARAIDDASSAYLTAARHAERRRYAGSWERPGYRCHARSVPEHRNLRPLCRRTSHGGRRQAAAQRRTPSGGRPVRSGCGVNGYRHTASLGSTFCRRDVVGNVFAVQSAALRSAGCHSRRRRPCPRWQESRNEFKQQRRCSWDVDWNQLLQVTGSMAAVQWQPSCYRTMGAECLRAAMTAVSHFGTWSLASCCNAVHPDPWWPTRAARRQRLAASSPSPQRNQFLVGP